MGEKQSKSASSKDTGHVKAVKHDPSLSGKVSEFWFLIDRVDLVTITSAKELHRRLVEKLSDLKDKILGVYVENDRQSRERREGQGFVYLKDYESTKDACTRMKLQMLGRHRINTTCVPLERKNKGMENEDGDNSLQKEKRLKEESLKQQYKQEIPKQEKETECQGKQPKTEVPKRHEWETLQQQKMDEQPVDHAFDQPNHRESKQQRLTSISYRETKNEDSPSKDTLPSCFVPLNKDNQTHSTSYPIAEQPDRISVPNLQSTAVIVSNEPSLVSAEKLYRKKKPGDGEVVFDNHKQTEKYWREMDNTFQFDEKVFVRPKAMRKKKEDEQKEQQDSSQERLKQQQEPQEHHHHHHHQQQQQQQNPAAENFSDDKSPPLGNRESPSEACFNSDYGNFNENSDTSGLLDDRPRTLYSHGGNQRSLSYDLSSRENHHIDSKKARCKDMRGLACQDRCDISSKKIKEDCEFQMDGLLSLDDYNHIPAMDHGEGTESQRNSDEFNCDMSDISESNVKNERVKEEFVVILYNLPVQFKTSKLVSLFRGRFEGFEGAFLAKQKGTAFAVFSSAEQATNCAEKMKGHMISGRKIYVHAKISRGGGSLPDERSLLDERSLFESEKVEADEELKAGLNQTENVPGDNTTASQLDRHSLMETGEVEEDEKVITWLDQNEEPPSDNETSFSSEICTVEDDRRSSLSDFTEELIDGITETDRESMSSAATCAQSEPTFTVTVSNLPRSISNKQLFNCFSKKCKGVKKVQLAAKNGRGRNGEVTFNTRKQMDMCVKNMDKSSLFGFPIRVRVKEPIKKENNEEKQLQDFSQLQKTSQSISGNGRTHVHAEVAEKKQKDDEKPRQDQRQHRQKQQQQRMQQEIPPQNSFAEDGGLIPENGENSYDTTVDVSDKHCEEDDFHNLSSKRGSLEDKALITNSHLESRSPASPSFRSSKTSCIDSNCGIRLQNSCKQDDMSSNEMKDKEVSFAEVAIESENPNYPGERTSASEGSDDFQTGSETLVITGIPKDKTKGFIRQFIESKGCEGVVKLIKSRRSTRAVLTFSTKNLAERGLKILHGLEWEGEMLKVEKGHSKSGTRIQQDDNEPSELVDDQNKNLTVKLHNVPPSTSTSELERFVMGQCSDVVISKLVKAEDDVYIAKFENEDNCKIVYETLRGMTFNDRKIRTTWANHSEKKKDQKKPYVVVSNLDPQFQEKAVWKIFDKYCRGVLSVEKKPNIPDIRVYFQSVDLAEKAVQEMDEFMVGQKKLKVKLGIAALKETQKNDLGGQLEKYTAELQRRRTELLNKNVRKLKEIEKLAENLPRKRSRWTPLEDFERREEARKTYELKGKELEDQRGEFETKYQELLDRLLVEAEDRRSVNDELGIKNIITKHRKAMKREFKRFDASLPIYAKRTEVIDILRENQVLVLIGETGSGKSTQLAQYVADELFSQPRSIVVTQPRKIAAVSLARRVAEEFGCSVGEEVGYQVGLSQKVSRKTIIKFVTDRILLNEVLKSRTNIEHYSCIIIDEAHERSIHTDLLLAMLKQILPQRPNLNLIVTSATLNTEIFRRYFDDCPVVKVQGRAFPVERVYAKERPTDYTDGVLERAVEVCQSGEQGDILIFLTQQNEIEKTSERLRERLGHGNVILPLHGKLQAEEQEMVFKPTPEGKRKIVVATNSAETSITIDGIRIVIDSGMVKEPSFDAKRNLTALDVKMVSKSSAMQRAGRAGRTGPGKCYCMYTVEDYSAMEQDAKPEILKMHLGMAVLQLLSLGVTDVEQFDFVEAPPRETLVTALNSLKQLGALDQDGTLTELGKQMLELPTDPKLSKALLEGLRRGCGEEIITVVGLMSSGRDIFYRGDTDEKKNKCEIQKQEYSSTSGDLLSALEVYKRWKNEPEKKQSQWCMKNALNAKTLRSTRETINEIKYALRKLRMNSGSDLEVTSTSLEEDLRKSLLAGYSENIAWSRGHEKLGYTVVMSNQVARIHPSSVLSSLGYQPDWILFQEMRRTTETFLLNVTPVESEWLAEVAMHMLQFVDEEEIRISQVIRERIHPVGPAIVKSVIGSRGSTLRQIENSVSEYIAEDPLSSRIAAENQSRIFCSIECNVEKGCVDIYCPRDCSEYAKSEVNTVIEKKRRDLLYGGTEMVISKIGYLKALVGNDMKTKLILQPGEFCKFDVFVTKEDETCEVDSEEVVRSLKDAGEVLHHNLAEAQNGKWGNVTYSSPEEAREAKQNVEFGFKETDQLPYNVERIKLKPCRVERLRVQNPVSVTGTRVIVTWYPFPANRRAYIKCTSLVAAYALCSKLSGFFDERGSFKGYRVSVHSKTGDIQWDISMYDDEKTLAEKMNACGLQSDMEAVTKITVPSRHNGTKVETETEKRNLFELMKKFGKFHVNNVWVANCHKVMASLVFPTLKDAKKAIEELDGQMSKLGSRAVYLELEGRSEIICNKRLYDKVKNIVGKIVEKHDGLDLKVKDMDGRGMKITITGNNAEDVQMIGGEIAEVVSAKSVPIEDPAVARSLSSGYGRNMLKNIDKRSGAFVQSSMIGRCIQITGSPEAKKKAAKLLYELLEELKKTQKEEILLKGSDVPVGAIREMLRKYGKGLEGLVEEDKQCEVEMDVRRRKLVLSGPKENVANVRVKVEAFLRGLCSPQRRASEQNEVCPVCLDEVDEPYRLNVCGHSYCCACISQYITSTLNSVKNADMFPQKCLYGGCKYPLTKEDYFAFLNHGQIEQLYRVSFESFVIGSDVYKPCPSPDCSWVYESTSSPEVFICPECNARMCRSCGDVPHELFDTCEAYRASKDPSKADELYEKWISGADTRKCPNQKCSVMIEKNEGCNHVHCTQCNAHICWKCGKYFSTAEQCYDHQNDCRR